jgi:hypothetical protein
MPDPSEPELPASESEAGSPDPGPSLLERLVPAVSVSDRLRLWLVIGAVVGVVTGFTVGQVNFTPGDDTATPAPTTTAPVDTAEEPEEDDTTTTTAVVPPAPSPLACVGALPPGTGPAAVVGVADVGANELAAALGVTTVVTESFDALVSGGAFDGFRAAALEAASAGPVVFVARLSSGVRQKTLSDELHQAAPGSVTVVIDPTGPPVPAELEPFADPSVMVVLEPGLPEPWVQEVARLATGAAVCPAPEG